MDVYVVSISGILYNVVVQNTNNSRGVVVLFRWMSIICSILCVSLLAVPNSTASAPVKKDRFYYENKGEVYWEVRTDQKMIALTFDDGPDPQQTIEILEILKQYDVKATFFAVGEKIAKYPEIAKKIVTEGHELGNHTYHHRMFRLPANADTVRAEMDQTEQEIVRATGRHSSLFRPPGGIYDETIVNVSKEMGLTPIMWSWHQDTHDWSRPGVRKIVNKVLKNARSGDIVLFHDYVSGGSQTTTALKEILPELQRQGYRMVTVSELIKPPIISVPDPISTDS